MAEHDADIVRAVIEDLEKAKLDHGQGLDVNAAAEWDARVGKLKRAVELLDPGRPSDVDRSAGVKLVNEVSADLHASYDCVGNWGTTEELRAAGMKAHNDLGRLIGT
jgi:hypothetical protein